jgi:hypothetical protein
MKVGYQKVDWIRLSDHFNGNYRLLTQWQIIVACSETCGSGCSKILGVEYVRSLSKPLSQVIHARNRMISQTLEDYYASQSLSCCGRDALRLASRSSRRPFKLHEGKPPVGSTCPQVRGRPESTPLGLELGHDNMCSPACPISMDYFVQIESAPAVEYGSNVYCSLDKLQVPPKGKRATSRDSVLFPRSFSSLLLPCS